MPRRSRSQQQQRRGRERHISVRSVRREQPDVRKLAKAVIALAMAQAEADALAQRDKAQTTAADGDDAHGR